MTETHEARSGIGEKLKNILIAILNAILSFLSSRKSIAVRLLYTILFLIVFEILKTIVQLGVIVQYIMLIISRKHSESVRRFCDKIAVYSYKVLRYVSLNESVRPYPFSDFPEEIDPPEESVNFD